MPQEKNELAPPYHANVFSGEALEKLVDKGFKSNGVIHNFKMRWPCGHEGDAIEISQRDYGSVKACYECARQYGLK